MDTSERGSLTVDSIAVSLFVNWEDKVLVADHNNAENEDFCYKTPIGRDGWGVGVRRKTILIMLRGQLR